MRTELAKLGKRPARHDVRTLPLSRYLAAPKLAAPIPTPLAVDYTAGITDWQMMLNDRLGCCTIAAIGHAVQTWTANASLEVTVPDATILNYYEKWNGYDPSDPATDQGGVELDVLNNWRQQGFAGCSLGAYVAIALNNGAADPSGNHADDPKAKPPTSQPTPEIATAIWLFGGAYVGVELPIRAQDQDVWDLPAHLGPDDIPRSWGGHAIYLVAYDLGVNAADDSSQDPSAPATLTCVTWGRVKKMTLRWFDKYCSEAFALVSRDWLKSTGVAPSGFDLATLEADLAVVTDVKMGAQAPSPNFVPRPPSPISGVRSTPSGSQNRTPLLEREKSCRAVAWPSRPGAWARCP